MAKKYLTKKLKNKVADDYYYLQFCLVEIFDEMTDSLLNGDTEYYDTKYKQLQDFLDTEIYRD